MIILIEGDNYFDSSKEFSRQLKEYIEKGFSVEELRADIDNFEQQLDLTQNQGLFATSTLYVLKEFKKLKVQQIEKLEVAASNIDLLILQDSSFDKRKSFYKNVKKSGKVYSFNKLRGKDLENWILEKCREFGIKIPSEAKFQTLLRLGDDQNIILSELDKLKKLQDEGEILTKEVIEAIIIDHSEVSVWDLTDNLISSNTRGSIRELDKITPLSEYEQIVGLIASQLRLLYIASISKTKEKMIEYKVHPFVASKLVSKVNKFPVEKVKKLYQKLVNMEIAVKTGRIDKNLALDLLVLAF